MIPRYAVRLIGNAPRTICAELIHDEGATVYLNGSEVYRFTMPSGVAGFDALASDAADYASEPLALNLNQLLPGSNVVAVEIH
jgi:hypothetical protein